MAFSSETDALAGANPPPAAGFWPIGLTTCIKHDATQYDKCKPTSGQSAMEMLHPI